MATYRVDYSWLVQHWDTFEVEADNIAAASGKALDTLDNEGTFELFNDTNSQREFVDLDRIVVTNLDDTDDIWESG